MTQASTEQITQLINAAGEGNAPAANQLLPLVYDELRALARSFFRHQPGNHTLQPTALVHEAYARMIKADSSEGDHARWKSRAHFFAVAAKAMRQILANHARERRAAKRGGEWQRITLSDQATPSERNEFDLLQVDLALEKLSALDAVQSRIVELRFFADMSTAEIAHVLEVSTSTVEREWRMAKAWLSAYLRTEPPS